MKATRNILTCPICGGSIIREAKEQHVCETVMLEGNILWLKNGGNWRRFRLPSEVVARVVARSKTEGFRLPPSPTEVQQRRKSTTYATE